MWTLVPDVLLNLMILTYSYARSDLYQREDLADTAKTNPIRCVGRRIRYIVSEIFSASPKRNNTRGIHYACS